MIEKGSYRILRRPEVEAATGLRRSSLYRHISEGLWPHPVSLGGRCVGWPASEVAIVVAARISGKTEAEIRLLVTTMEAGRTQVFESAVDSGRG